ncbi:carbamate kinase [Photobacterium sanctipauli]|uniref:Carbamate kinase n=1 Tax=Photobacterium sanctipauli TaxID=1342794 RepID=A0A2T3NUE1_9GAMM|nr:carbamate kinase [Photobacterium sanctipauli]PSW19835.1 carbamate kinase [Photobacterium sanctipauli]
MKKRIVLALGGNALLKRGEVLSVENQYKSIHLFAELINDLAKEYSITIVHGNGPQVGLLALQNLAYKEVPAYPLDVLVAESQGMIGYMIAQALEQQAGMSPVTCLMTRVCVDANDSAFEQPSKFIGPVYQVEQMSELKEQYGWNMKVDGDYIRRVVPSPKPQQIVEAKIIDSLLTSDSVVICAGGGGVPVTRKEHGYQGVEAVIDKDSVSALLAEQIEADHLLILTDADAVYIDWGTENQRALRDVTSEELQPFAQPDGAMGPKAEAVINFVERTKNTAYIGALQDVKAILKGEKGTCIRPVETAVPDSKTLKESLVY